MDGWTDDVGNGERGRTLQIEWVGGCILHTACLVLIWNISSTGTGALYGEEECSAARERNSSVWSI